MCSKGSKNFTASYSIIWLLVSLFLIKNAGVYLDQFFYPIIIMIVGEIFFLIEAIYGFTVKIDKFDSVLNLPNYFYKCPNCNLEVNGSY